MLFVLNSSSLNSVQDLGRTGYRAIGVGTAGAMDSLALRLGNRLVGNAAGAAAIEIALPPFSVRFRKEAVIAVTGALVRMTLDGEPVQSWSVQHVRAGQRLAMTGPHAAGARAYLCVRGGINVPLVMGSRSTDVKGRFGGHEGRALRRGDQLTVFPRFSLPGKAGPAALLAAPDYGQGSGLENFLPGHTVPVRVLPAAEYEWLDANGEDDFWSADWKVSSESNRMGYRFIGPELSLHPGLEREMLSHGIVNGVVQMPPSHQPIIQLNDCNVSGGYPKLGVVIQPDLRVLAQVPLGGRVNFQRVGPDEALAARAAEAALTPRLEADAMRLGSAL